MGSSPFSRLNCRRHCSAPPETGPASAVAYVISGQTIPWEGERIMSGNSEAIVGRHARAIRIMTCLQAGPAFNARELADRMSVSRRTIYRDLNLIREAGIGVEFDNQYAGYKVAPPANGALTPPAFSDRDL